MYAKTYVLCLSLLFASGLSYARSIDNVLMHSSDGLVHLQMDGQVGTVSRVVVGAERSSAMITFDGADVAFLRDKVRSWASQNALIQGASVVQRGEEVQLLIDFAKQVYVKNETVVALGQNRSRMDVVFAPIVGKQGIALLDRDQPQPELKEITVARKGGMVELTLAGNQSLSAEAAFRDSPPALIVDLPGVSVAQLQQSINALGFAGLPGFIRGLQVDDKQNGGLTRLIVHLSEPADLVHTSGILRQANSILRMHLVADSQATTRSNILNKVTLTRQQGRLNFVLDGTAGNRINAYVLDSPPRLMIDLLGSTPDQVVAAVTAFSEENNPTVQAVRYGETRLGSARLEFELIAGVQLVDTVIRREADTGRESFVVALDAPGLSQVLSGIPIGAGERLSGLDLRYSPQHDYSGNPNAVAWPLALHDRADWGNGQDYPEVGREFELTALYQLALDNDAKYLAAQADFRANAEAIVQARAGYLPTVALDYKYSSIRQDIKEASNSAFPTGKTRYDGRNASLTITQPILKMPALVKMDLAKVAVQQAEVNLLAAEQDLMIRLAEHYLNLLAAKDALELAQAEREATAKQLELAKTNFQSGLGSIIELHDAEGRYALILTKEIYAMNELDLARSSIKEIVGVEVSDVRGFREDFVAVSPLPAVVGPWVEAALSNNLALHSRKLASRIAQLEIKRQKSGHYPRVDLIGTLARDKTDGSIYGAGQETENSQIILQLNVPLYSGGMTSSVVRESFARWEKSTLLQKEEYRRTESLARAAFLGVLTSSETLAALRKMVKAQESALAGRIDGFKAGLYNVVDVLDGYKLYYAARRDYLKTRYVYLLNRLRLKQAVGSLHADDLEDLAALLAEK